MISMPDNLRLKWQGKINNSAIELAGKVIQCKKENKQEKNKSIVNYSLIVLIILSTIFAVINGVDMRKWVENEIDFIIIGLWISSAVIYVWYSRKSEDASDFEKYRNILMNRLDAGFCPCIDVCKHKEVFMQYMKEKYDINLYY